MGVLRLILAISVVIAHSSPIFGFKIMNSNIAVQSFYIISGFYMSMILTKKYNKKEDYWLFLSNRILRLFPTYLVVLIATISISILSFIIFNYAPIIDRILILNNNSSILALLSITASNFLIIGQDVMMFLAIDSNGQLYLTSDFSHESLPCARFLLLPQAWTLSLEILFYFVAPYLVRRKTYFLILLSLTSLFLRLYLYKIGYNHDPWNYRFFPNELLFFIAGILSYRLSELVKSKYNVWIFIGVITVTVFQYQLLTFGFHLIEIIFPMLIFISIPSIFKLTERNKLDQLMGEFSFPIYISHILIIRTIHPLFEKFDISKDYLGLFSLIFSIIASIVIIKFVIQPIERIRQNRVLKSSTYLTN